MARPLKPIDPKQVEAMAAIGCSGEEIAAVLGCSRDLIYKRFSTVLKAGHEKRNASVRRAQYEVGVNKKNAVMLIWLGKQFLNQRDKNESGTPEDWARMSDDELRRIINEPAYEGASLDAEAAESR